VKNLGSKAVITRFAFIYLPLCLLLACSQPTGKEFFCEHYSQDSTVNLYRQQIVRLSEHEICVVWPLDTLQCAKAGELSMTKWIEGTDAAQQIRGHLQATFSSQQVSLVILPFMRQKGDLSIGVATPTEQLQYVFLPSEASLQLTSGKLEQKSISFVCKPWEKQKWWSIY